jgi:hypothetical protein
VCIACRSSLQFVGAQLSANSIPHGSVANCNKKLNSGKKESQAVSQYRLACFLRRHPNASGEWVMVRWMMVYDSDLCGGLGVFIAKTVQNVNR